MQVVVVPNHRVPAVVQMVWYKLGAATTRSEIRHRAFSRTSDVQGNGRQPAGRLHGVDCAQRRARQRIHDPRLHRLSRDHCARPVRPRHAAGGGPHDGLVLDDKVVLPERDVVLEERRMRIDNEPASLLAEQLRATLFLHHPYRNPTIGWVNESACWAPKTRSRPIANGTPPNNAILVIAGDVDSPKRARSPNVFRRD